MKPALRVPLILPVLMFLQVTFAVAAVDWAPVTDAEMSMKSNPLDPGSGAVVLFKHGQIEVVEETAGHWVTRIRTYVRIKVLTDAGRDSGNVAIDAPKWVRFSKVEGRTISPSGGIVPLDSSKVFHGSAIEIGRNYAVVKTTFAFSSVEPGAILEYETEETADSLFPPPWYFDTEGLGTLESSLRVVIGPRLAMAQFPIETTQNKISVKQDVTVKGSQFDYSVADLRPIIREPYRLPFRDQAATVLLTPYKLSFSGEVFPVITSWDDVAAMVSRWFQDVNKSTKEAKNQAKELAEKAPDDRQKAEAIYAYLQKNIVSNDLVGIGFSRTADDVITSKRGDPDEINAVFVTMLKEAKVDADPVLVAARDWQTLSTQFPNISQFSRMITRVNLKQGPVFVDASDAAAPFGELPWSERGITGLAVKGTKIQAAPIPLGAPDDNSLAAKLTFQVSKDWKIDADEEMDFKGAEAIDYRDDLLHEAPDRLDQRLKSFFAFGEADAVVSGIAYPDLRDSTKPLVLKAKVESHLVDESGPGQLLVNPWVGDRYGSPVFKSSERHSAVRFEYPEKRVSTSVWMLPPEIKAASLPKDVSLDNEFGSFSHTCTQSGNVVTCARTFVLKNKEIADSKAYLAAKAFFEEVAKHDQEVMVLQGQ